ncbi:MAG: alpha/beta fold hydrolase [Anaerolineae bacterium]|nr:alpha/beta fold hydrolase [Anaerolineae bacterium]
MTTDTLELVQTRNRKKTQGLSGTPRRLVRGLLALVLTVIALVSLLPVILLFFLTAVPPVIAAVLAMIDAAIVAALFWPNRTSLSVFIAVVGWIAVAVLAVLLSQHFASTPPITDRNGDAIPGSIASLESVELNNSTQWITIRSHSEDLPVLLFLAGGPGGSELVMTRQYLAELEEHFIVVNWDQPGTGKSYNAVPRDQLTPERFIEDGYALTAYLCERFEQDKIYVLGESWGSILGVWLVQHYPDLYHAFISTGQMIDPVENDIEMYEFALQLATEQGNADLVEQLHRNGPPPYQEDELLDRFQAMNGIINNYMHAHAHGEGTGHNLMFDSLAAQEYGLLDKVYWGLSLLNTFPHVYSQLNDVDLREQATRIDVPMYFIRGHWDMNSSHSLTEEYIAMVDAPQAELIWFDDAAHTPLWDSPRHFVDVLVNTVLAQTRPQMEGADGDG